MKTLSFAGVAHIHAPAFFRTVAARKDLKITSVWDDNAERRAYWARQAGAPEASSVDAAIAAADAVVVTSETDKHAALVGKVTAAKKAIFVEKPIGMAAVDANAMAVAIEKAGVIFQTGYFQRSDPTNQAIKAMIAGGELGRVTKAYGSNTHPGAITGLFKKKPDAVYEDWNWMTEPKLSGVGGFGDLGTHALDILIWWLGDVTRVTAQIDPVTKTYACDESGQGLIRFASGVTATLTAGWVDAHDPVKYLVSGTEGHAAVIGGKLFVTRGRDAKFDLAKPVTDLPPAAPHAFDLFLDAVVGQTPVVPLVTVREAAYRSAVMAAMYEGAAGNTWVTPAK